MIENFVGILFSVTFCIVGPVVDGKCEDGTPARVTQVLVATARHCERDALFRVGDCEMANLIEVVRNGEVVATLPASVLTEVERRLLMQSVVGLHR